MPIVITIDDKHPAYHDLADYLENPDARSAAFAMIEQHADGIWSLRLARVTPTQNYSSSKPYSGQIHIEKR